MKHFEDFHPVALLIFFMTVLFYIMFFMNIYCSVIALIAGIIYRWVLIKKAEIKNMAVSVIWIVMITVFNMLVSHDGERILLFINNKAITVEAMEYGFVSGCMVSGTFTWFMCIEKVINTEKIQYIFKNLPKLGLLISMILRLVPRYVEKYKKVMEMNENADALEVSSGVFTYALENSMQTAKAMEMRGFSGAKRIYSGFRFKKKDFIMICINVILLILFFVFKMYRVFIVLLVCTLPLIYRGKELLRLWIYNLKK